MVEVDINVLVALAAGLLLAVVFLMPKKAVSEKVASSCVSLLTLFYLNLLSVPSMIAFLAYMLSLSVSFLLT